MFGRQMQISKMQISRNKISRAEEKQRRCDLLYFLHVYTNVSGLALLLNLTKSKIVTCIV